MKRVLVDTRPFLIAAGAVEGKLSAKVVKLLSDGNVERLLSVVSVLEINLKSRAGKLEMSGDHVRTAVEDLDLTLIPFTEEHVFAMWGMAELPKDPFDRMLIATAMAEDVALIGGEREFGKCKGLRLVG